MFARWNMGNVELCWLLFIDHLTKEERQCQKFLFLLGWRLVQLQAFLHCIPFDGCFLLLEVFLCTVGYSGCRKFSKRRSVQNQQKRPCATTRGGWLAAFGSGVTKDFKPRRGEIPHYFYCLRWISTKAWTVNDSAGPVRKQTLPLHSHNSCHLDDNRLLHTFFRPQS